MTTNTTPAGNPENAAHVHKAPGGFRLSTATVEIKLTDEEAKGIMLSALQYVGISRRQINAETGAWLGGWAA